MLQQKIYTPDVQLMKVLVARRLQDGGIGMNADSIAVTSTDDGGWARKLDFRFPLRKLSITIVSSIHRSDVLDVDRIQGIAKEQAEAFQRVARDSADLEMRISEAKAVAKREIAKLKRRGLAMSLLEASPCAIDVGDDWLPSPEIYVEVLNASLQAERCPVVAETPEDLVRLLTEDRFIEEQTSRAIRKEWLDQAGAAGAIDGLVLAALQEGGADVADVIRRMRATDDGFAVQAGGRQLNLRWEHGVINASFQLTKGASYRNRAIYLDEALAPEPGRSLAGKCARELLDSPILEGFTVAEADDSLGKLKIVLQPRRHLFGAETCEPQERLLPM